MKLTKKQQREAMVQFIKASQKIREMNGTLSKSEKFVFSDSKKDEKEIKAYISGRRPSYEKYIKKMYNFYGGGSKKLKSYKQNVSLEQIAENVPRGTGLYVFLFKMWSTEKQEHFFITEQFENLGDKLTIEDITNRFELNSVLVRYKDLVVGVKIQFYDYTTKNWDKTEIYLGQIRKKAKVSKKVAEHLNKLKHGTFAVKKNKA